MTGSIGPRFTITNQITSGLTRLCLCRARQTGLELVRGFLKAAV